MRQPPAPTGRPPGAETAPDAADKVRWAHLQGQWARLLVASFADAGIRQVVASPGSRSTPFLLAALREPRLAVRDVVDERAAAFYALGRARASGRPSLLLCTSGTAAAHYLPAVIEAAMSGVPMLILTADRPLELVDCGANQTIDQVNLFGDHARGFLDLGLADGAEPALRGLRRRVAQAVHLASSPRAGAVQLNARARKPLEPPGADALEALPPDDPAHALPARVDRLLLVPLVRPRQARRVPAEADLEELADLCSRVEKGVLVAGPGPAEQTALAPKVAELSRRTGYPLLADLASQLRGANCPCLEAVEALVTGEAWQQLRPRLIVQIGRAPTTTAWTRRLAEDAEAGALVSHWVLGAHGWQDPTSTASDLLLADPGDTLEALLANLPATMRTDSAWAETWSRVARVARGAVSGHLESHAVEAPLGEGVTTALAVGAVPEDGLLVLGNSLAVRHADLFAGAPRRGVRVLGQRGASGIDGLVAGAAGAADESGRPTLLLLGDVSLQHDVSSLLEAARCTAPLVIVVIDNRGGRIFEQLPVTASIRGTEMDHWLTPPASGGRDFAHAAAYAGLRHRLAERRGELESALEEAFATDGAWLLEARVPPSAAAAERRRLVEELEELIRLEVRRP